MIGITVYLSRDNDKSIQSPSVGCVGTQVYFIIGVLLLVLAYYGIMKWNAQFQPGGYFLP
jgi:hypothetical protein